MTKIITITRVRNESAIMQDSLDYWAEFSDMIFVYDDNSTDNTAEIAANHPSVTRVLVGLDRHPDRDIANYRDRQRVLEMARPFCEPDTWIYYTDADERIEIDWDWVRTCKFRAIACKLLDAYITPDDLGKGYKARRWFGPEYREILMLFQANTNPKYWKKSQRTADINVRPVVNGWVRHYGKAISVEQWEETCRYYTESKFSAQPRMKSKWEARKGKAVHDDGVSDYGNPLILWEEREEKAELFTTKSLKYHR